MVHVYSRYDERLVIASTINREDYYEGEHVSILLVIPYDEVYGEIERQNGENLINIVISSGVSFVIFVISTMICMVYVKRKIVKMVSAISELNKCALMLSSNG